MMKNISFSVIKLVLVLLRWQILQEKREILVPRDFVISDYPNLLPLMHF